MEGILQLVHELVIVLLGWISQILYLCMQRLVVIAHVVVSEVFPGA